jgi:hypothetical protein
MEETTYSHSIHGNSAVRQHIISSDVEDRMERSTTGVNGDPNTLEISTKSSYDKTTSNRNRQLQDTTATNTTDKFSTDADCL